MNKSILCTIIVQTPEERALRIAQLAAARPPVVAEIAASVPAPRDQARMWRINPESRYWRIPV